MIKVYRLIACLAVLLLAAGCAGCGRGASAEPGKNVSTASSRATGSSPGAASSSKAASAIPERDLDAAFGGKTVHTFTAVLKDGALWLPICVTNDAIYGFTAATKTKLSQIVGYDMKTQTARVLYTIKNKYQPEFMKSSSNYLVWTDYLPPYGNGGEHVMLYDKRTGKTQVLDSCSAESAQMNDVQIAVSDRMILWSYANPGPDKQPLFHIYKFDPGSSRKSVYKKDAYMPVIGSDFVAWLGPKKDGSTTGSILNLQPAGKDQPEVVSAPGFNPIYIAACGDRLVYSGNDVTDSGKMLVQNNRLILYSNGKQSLIEESSEHDYEFPQISGRFISWDENVKKRFFVIGQNLIVDLPSEYGEAYVSDQYVMWGSDAIQNETKEQAEKDGMYKTLVHYIAMT